MQLLEQISVTQTLKTSMDCMLALQILIFIILQSVLQQMLIIHLLELDLSIVTGREQIFKQIFNFPTGSVEPDDIVIGSVAYMPGILQ